MIVSCNRDLDPYSNLTWIFWRCTCVSKWTFQVVFQKLEHYRVQTNRQMQPSVLPQPNSQMITILTIICNVSTAELLVSDNILNYIRQYNLHELGALRIRFTYLHNRCSCRLPQLMPMRSGRRSEPCPGSEKRVDMESTCNAMLAISWACWSPILSGRPHVTT